MRHKPGSRLPLLSARPTVTLATLKVKVKVAHTRLSSVSKFDYIDRLETSKNVPSKFPIPVGKSEPPPSNKWFFAPTSRGQIVYHVSTWSLVFFATWPDQD